MTETSKPHSRLPIASLAEAQGYIEHLEEQLEIAEAILRIANAPVIHAETWADGIHARARAYWANSNPAISPPGPVSGEDYADALKHAPAKRPES